MQFRRLRKRCFRELSDLPRPLGMKRLLVSAVMVASLLSATVWARNASAKLAPQGAKSNPQGPQSAAPSSYDARAFSAELQRISLALETKSSPGDLAALKKSIPPNWDV